MPDVPLVAHSLAEAYLYLMATPCGACGKGPLEGSDAHSIDSDQGSASVAIPAACGACGERVDIRFALTEGLGADPNGPPIVNPTDEPSRIIDVAQWVTLFRMITEAAAKEEGKVAARELGLEAAQCLDEALRFYDDGENDLPPAEAFYCESSRRRFADHPQQFSRQRLIDLRAKLPTASAMRSRIEAGNSGKKKPWWRRWR